MGVEVGSGTRVAVAVFSAGRISAGWDVDVALSCPTGAEVDSAGLAQADINIIITNNRDTVRFMIPHFVGKTKRAGRPRPYKRNVVARRALARRSNLLLELGIASGERASSPFEARRNDGIATSSTSILHALRL